MEKTTISKTIISPAQDPQSPYYLHHSDHPGLVIITPKLSTNNYISRSKSFLLAISIKNKLGFLNGTISKPTITDPLFDSWIRYNNLIAAWILESITPSIASTIFYIDSTVEI